MKKLLGIASLFAVLSFVPVSSGQPEVGEFLYSRLGQEIPLPLADREV